MGYSDADWAGDAFDHHSTTGNFFLWQEDQLVGSAKNNNNQLLPFNFRSDVALKYGSIGISLVKAGLTMTKLKGPTVIMEDNQGTVAIAKNPVSYTRTTAY